MAQLIVRNIEEVVKTRLRSRARRHRHSMEAELRDILRNAALAEQEAVAPLGARLRLRFAGIGLDREVEELRGQKAKPARIAR